MAGKLNLSGLRISCLVTLISLTAVPSAGAAGRVPEGKSLAQTWCSACHLVDVDQKTANADAPSFAAIAAMLDGADDEASLQLFLADPHPVMPNMSLSRQEVADLVAYIASLRDADD